jgi:hypothetical protein
MSRLKRSAGLSVMRIRRTLDAYSNESSGSHRVLIDENSGFPISSMPIILLQTHNDDYLYAFGIENDNISHPVTRILVLPVCDLIQNLPNKPLLCPRYDSHHNEDSA